MKKLFLLLAAVVLSGCSTTPMPANLAKEVKASTSFQVEQGKVPVTIVRDKGHVGSYCLITAFINGDPVAELDAGEKVIAYVSPGEVIVGAGFMGAGLCSGDPKKEREFIIKDKQPRTLRIFTDQNANVDILPTTEN
ncbi:hypothetical protein [Pragia fontium]|uniref:hypothetical protein n=1 Tax=Pragia fontium TaxID=82985 RepID=UPI000F6E34D0|nr:hypothetical protein [Pragia fontium]VEJ54648.1 Uncharacterised protein [Pragia fontium]